MSEHPQPQPPRASRLKRVFAFAERCLAILGLVFLVFHSGFGVSEIVSPSMSPTLEGEAGEPDNDWFLFETVSVKFAPPPRRKLVVFTSNEGTQVAKRVMGFGGERLRVHDGDLEVDGRLEPVDGVRYLRAGKLRPRQDPRGATEVPAGTLFVLGDDSKDSWDSRFFGGLERKQWKGRVVGVVWPPSRWSWLW